MSSVLNYSQRISYSLLEGLWKMNFKAMDEGRPLEGARVHYDFFMTTVK